MGMLGRPMNGITLVRRGVILPVSVPLAQQLTQWYTQRLTNQPHPREPVSAVCSPLQGRVHEWHKAELPIGLSTCVQSGSRRLFSLS